MAIKVFDFFSGCGGTSRGFKNSGMDIIFALDNDKDAAETFHNNFPETHFCNQSITDIKTSYLEPFVEACGDSPLLFCGCAPCQPFTKQNTSKPNSDKRTSLLDEFRRFVECYLPHYVFIENVPGMQKLRSKKNPFHRFLKYLEENSFHTSFDIVYSQSYGVPQRRRRLVLIASRLAEIEFPPETHGPTTGREFATVRQSIIKYPAIEQGETHPVIPNHRAAALSPLNLRRIQATPEGGGRMNWPDDLVLECHKKQYRGHTDVYGRMLWDEPSTGLTTRCISLSNGRFGHPVQDRAISVREAASLQTFPDNFIFSGTLSSMAKQIGNAVPVKLAEKFGQQINNHYYNRL